MDSDRPAERLFFALWPDPALRNRINRLACELPEVGGRRHHPEDLHLTLVFLGAVTAAQRACIERVGDRVALHPFGLRLDRIEHWASPRILCLGASHRPAPLLSLVQQLQSGLDGCGFAAEERPYRPHVTLVRNVRSPPSTRPSCAVEWAVGEFVLAGTAAGEMPPRYRVVRRWPL